MIAVTRFGMSKVSKLRTVHSRYGGNIQAIFKPLTNVGIYQIGASISIYVGNLVFQGLVNSISEDEVECVGFSEILKGCLSGRVFSSVGFKRAQVGLALGGSFGEFVNLIEKTDTGIEQWRVTSEANYNYSTAGKWRNYTTFPFFIKGNLMRLRGSLFLGAGFWTCTIGHRRDNGIYYAEQTFSPTGTASYTIDYTRTELSTATAVEIHIFNRVTGAYADSYSAIFSNPVINYFTSKATLRSIFDYEKTRAFPAGIPFEVGTLNDTIESFSGEPVVNIYELFKRFSVILRECFIVTQKKIYTRPLSALREYEVFEARDVRTVSGAYTGAMYAVDGVIHKKEMASTAVARKYGNPLTREGFPYNSMAYYSSDDFSSADDILRRRILEEHFQNIEVKSFRFKGIRIPALSASFPYVVKLLGETFFVEEAEYNFDTGDVRLMLSPVKLSQTKR